MAHAAARPYCLPILSGPDPITLGVAGFAVGVVVGLTGMGGGAVMTPVLVLLLRVQPLTAIGSDLVASLFMKPVGVFVHWRRGTVEKEVVKLLVLGSVPAAFSGVFLVRLLGTGSTLQARVQLLLGAALLLAVAGILARSWRRPTVEADAEPILRRPLTIAIGALAGLVVGVTSVGSGSLVIVLLMAVYPGLSGRRLVATDLTQAVPMVGAAALGHLVYGEVNLGVAAAILVGAIPGTYLGSRISAVGPDLLIRPSLAVVLYASALKLLGVALVQPATLALGVLVAAAVAYLTAVRPGARRLTLIRLAAALGPARSQP